MQVHAEQVDIFTRIRNQAIRYLSYREHSARELTLKLSKKFDSISDISEVIAYLLDNNFLSDARYAESYIRMRVNKGYGPERIRSELNFKGVSKEIVEESINQCKADWDQIILNAWQKKFGHYFENIAPEEKSKQWRFLQYRGFSHEQIKNLFQRA